MGVLRQSNTGDGRCLDMSCGGSKFLPGGRHLLFAVITGKERMEVAIYVGIDIGDVFAGKIIDIAPHFPSAYLEAFRIMRICRA